MNNELENKCFWCENEFEDGELIETNLGLLCEDCIRALKSRGEEVVIY